MARQHLTDFELMILLAILRIGDDAYGVPIAKEIENTGGRTALLGAIYAALDRLDENGLVTSSAGDPTPARGGRAKRYFKVTGKGLTAVKETRRAFTAREPLTAAELAKPGDREFLIAALGPGRRAVSINVDAVKSTAGLVAPGDHVDVILTQTFAAQASDPAHRSVGETVLRDLRVIAVDQTISPVASKPGDGRNALGEAHMPKTITLEVTERQGAMLLVADQLGKIQLALRGQQDRVASPLLTRLLTRDESSPTWASDVSKALVQPKAAAAAAAPETARAEIAIIRGSKTERLCESPTGLAPCK